MQVALLIKFCFWTWRHAVVSILF